MHNNRCSIELVEKHSLLMSTLPVPPMQRKLVKRKPLGDCVNELDILKEYDMAFTRSPRLALAILRTPRKV